jgi:formate/nitrite transporter FocA (FNT family)
VDSEIGHASRGPRPESASVPLFDAYTPAEIAVRVRNVGVAKATAPVLTTVALAVLAGAFISLGALFYTVTVTGEAGVPFGLIRLAGGVAFSLGLILVVVGGAELFTGNNLIAMAWASGCLHTGDVLRHWVWVYGGNLLGALGTAALVLLAGVHQLGDGALGETAIRIARAKASLDPVANMYLLPVGIALAASSAAPISPAAAAGNLVLVTVGNIIGGTVLVAGVYWFVYLRTAREDER